MDKTFTLVEGMNMYVNELAVEDNTVAVVYNGNTVAGNIAKYLTITTSGAHVNIAQSDDVAEEHNKRDYISYTRAGTQLARFFQYCVTNHKTKMHKKSKKIRFS